MNIEISKDKLQIIRDCATIIARVIDNSKMGKQNEEADFPLRFSDFVDSDPFLGVSLLKAELEPKPTTNGDPSQNLLHEPDLRPLSGYKRHLLLKSESTYEDLRYNMFVKAGTWSNKKAKQEITIFRAAPGWMLSISERGKKATDQDTYHIEIDFNNIGFYKDRRFNIITHNVDQNVLTLWPGGEFTHVDTEE